VLYHGNAEEAVPLNMRDTGKATTSDKVTA